MGKKFRTHDEFYLKEDRKNNPKEYFKFIHQLLSEKLNFSQDLSLLDIGCATGDFVYYINSLYPHMDIHGMDILGSLLEKAREEVPNVTFHQGAIDKEHLQNKKFDIITMSGVHQIFDACSEWIDNSIEMINEGGTMVFFGIFNPNPVDGIFKFKRSDLDVDTWETGWNAFSHLTVKEHFAKKGITNVEFHKFQIEIDLPKHDEDPLRSWTMKMEDGTRSIMHGGLIFHDMYACIVKT